MSNSTPGHMHSEIVYFVGAETLGLIKIGTAFDMHARLKDLRSGCPDELTVLGVMRAEKGHALERRLHALFQTHHHHGEWFSPCPEIFDFIERETVSLDLDDRQRVQAASVRRHGQTSNVRRRVSKARAALRVV